MAQIDPTRGEQRSPARRSSPALFRYGFRPFFLFAGIQATTAMLVWLTMQSGLLLAPGPWPAPLWHGHEMIFGYAAAVLAGFMLTAVPSWTGAAPMQGRALAALATLWLAGRAAMALGDLMPASAVAAIDVAFLPLLGITIIPSIVRKRQWRNSFVVAVLLGLTATNIWSHVLVAGAGGGDPGLALTVAVDIVLILLVAVGGRIVPAFTRSGLRGPDREIAISAHAGLDRAAILTVVALAVADAAAPGSLAVGALALLAGGVNALRLAGWKSLQTVRLPILWVLHLGYAALVAGLILKGLGALLPGVVPVVGLHALTVGAVGIMTLAVMSRAALGHTGRLVVAHPLTVASYVLLFAAAVLRVVVPFMPPDFHTGGLHIAGGLWSAAFALFVAVYGPMLVRPRVDGRPG